jgi:O-antigen/teichoic acid export membrane protein
VRDSPASIEEASLPDTAEPKPNFDPSGPAQRAETADYAAQSEHLGRRTLRGSLFTLGSYFGVNVIGLAASLILTRLLAQEYFGIMLLVTTVMVGIRLFSDIGIGPALIAHPRGDDERFLRTAWTMQVIRGFCIWVVAIALAYPVAVYFARTDPANAILATLLPVAGFVAVIEGLRSTAIFRLQRRLQFGQLSTLDLIEITVTCIGMVSWALVSRSVWALVIPPLIGSVSAMIASHFLLRDRHDRIGWDRPSARELMTVGRWIFVSTVLTFLAGQFDRLIFGKLIDAETLAIYAVAVRMSIMPTVAVLKVGGSVLFPTFSRVADDPARFADVYKRARTMLLTIAALITSGLIACGPFVIPALYKVEFDGAGWMLQLLAVSVWFQIVDAANIAALLARQRSMWMAAGNLTKVVFMFSLVPLAFYTFGTQGLAAAIVAIGLADAARAVASTLGVRRLGLATRTLVPDFAYPLLILAIGWAGLFTAQWLAPQLAPHVPDGKFHRFFLNTALCVAGASIVSALWLPMCLWQWKLTRHRA